MGWSKSTSNPVSGPAPESRATLIHQASHAMFSGRCDHGRQPRTGCAGSSGRCRLLQRGSIQRQPDLHQGMPQFFERHRPQGQPQCLRHLHASGKGFGR